MALKIIKFQQEDSSKHYNCLQEVLNYIRALAPDDIKSEIWEDLCKISLKEFSEALQINPFVPNAPFLYPLKTSENHKLFWYFQGVEKGCIDIGNKWVKLLYICDIRQ